VRREKETAFLKEKKTFAKGQGKTHTTEAKPTPHRATISIVQNRPGE
jgi:hypothetical protein